MNAEKTDLRTRAEVYAHLHALIARGNHIVALEDATRIAETAADPMAALQALTYQVIAAVNLRRTSDCVRLLSRAFAAVDAHWDAAIAGELHVLAGWLAFQRGASDLSVRHVILARRIFERADPAGLGVLDGWHDVALTFSYLGLHEHALAAIEQVRRAELRAGNRYDSISPEVPLRYALARDHRGDPAGCLRVLAELVADAGARRARGTHPFPPTDWGYVAYAVARRAAMGEASDVDASDYAEDLGTGPEEQELRAMIAICGALAAGDGDGALELLAGLRLSEQTFGAAEPHRLRVLAHTLRGDVEAALDAQNAMLRLVCDRLERYSDLFVDGVAARIDHEHLRHKAVRYAGDARTDPLTGLPNRRYLHHYVEDLALHGTPAMLGLCDLDGFKAVNDIHGHAVGDLVLERIAAIMARIVRRHDLVARYGGDEFVLILPAASPEQAGLIGERLLATIEAEDWATLVPGTRLTASIGWSPLDPRDPSRGIRAADEAMYAMKSLHHG
ncbi:GGDEF domain-containing protein [Longispora sp. NPDC051575]|uniref:GGDEF domain-containing protein n=1 Tax=Longispora sp. NPDC051575 TaxID=3154943 RepID=UPI00342A700F